MVAMAQNALLALVDAGETAVAASLLWRCRPLYSAIGTPLDRVKLLGLEAKIAFAQGQPARAERLFREEIRGFLAAGLVYDVALVWLDLVNVLLDLGRTMGAIDLVDDMLETFRALNVHREAFMTVLMLRRALEQGRASARLVRRIAGRIRRLENGFVQRG
jgi:tetratricopeptide (TPR) repeat protein